MKRAGDGEMLSNVGRVVLLVRDYDEAIDFYAEKLGFEVFVDIDAGERRYVHIRLPQQHDFGIWLMKAETADQEQRVGAQTDGQPCCVMYRNDLGDAYDRLTARGVHFIRGSQSEDGATFAHFVDLYGNEIVLVELSE